MSFKRIISEEGYISIFKKNHEIFSIPIFREFNFDKAVPIKYRDLFLISDNRINFASRDELINHLQLLDSICYVNRQKKVLDYAIANYENNMEEWERFVNPSIIDITPEYLINFPSLIDNYLEQLSKLKGFDDLKRKKLLEYARNNNTESFDLLFDKSLINNRFLKELVKYGIKFIEIIIEKGFNNWDRGMKYAALQRKKELIDFFIDKGATDWDNGLRYSAQAGDKYLIDFFISKGANNWDGGMYGAAKGGHENLILFFINKGANNWSIGMYNAALGGHKDIVNLFITIGTTNYNLGILGATKGGHRHLVDFFISKGGNESC